MESVQIKFTFSVYIQFIPNIFSQMINYLYISVAFCSKLLLNVYKRKIILEYTLNNKVFFLKKILYVLINTSEYEGILSYISTPQT